MHTSAARVGNAGNSSFSRYAITEKGIFFIFRFHDPPMLFTDTYVRGAPRPPEPLAAGSPTLHLLRSALPTSHGVISVCTRSITNSPLVAFVPRFSALFFIRCDFLRSTPGGCFPQRSLSATTVSDKTSGRFCGTFYRRPCATFYGGAGLVFVAPRKGCSPLTSAWSVTLHLP